jgi:hypothetical protein
MGITRPAGSTVTEKYQLSRTHKKIKKLPQWPPEASPQSRVSGTDNSGPPHGWCYWGAIPVVIWCGEVRIGSGSEFLETSINTGDFALFRFRAHPCGLLSMDYKAAALPLSYAPEIAHIILREKELGSSGDLGWIRNQSKYAIVSHGHIDHAGGAKYPHDHFGTHIILSAADWDLLDHDNGTWPKPTRDVIASDGQKLTPGNTTLTLYLTPGHTLGSISTLIPVKDAGTSHLALEWGGTGFNWIV